MLDGIVDLIKDIDPKRHLFLIIGTGIVLVLFNIYPIVAPSRLTHHHFENFSSYKISIEYF